MKKTACLILFALSLGLISASPAAAELTEGTWKGTISPPGAGPIKVTYTVRKKNGKLTIVMHSQTLGDNEFRDIRVSDDRLTFSWTAGSSELNCELKRVRDGSYRGDCTDSTGTSGRLEMIPPG